MRDFFINGFEILLGIILVLMIIGIIVFAGVVAFGGGMMMNGQPMPGGPAMGAGILVAGLLYVLFVGGLMYLGLGIYQNTKKTAAAMERMASK